MFRPIIKPNRKTSSSLNWHINASLQLKYLRLFIKGVDMVLL